MQHEPGLRGVLQMGNQDPGTVPGAAGMGWGGAAHRDIRGYGPCQWLHPAVPEGRNGPCFQQRK